MAFTPEQENALLALLDEPLVTLNELPKAANIDGEDLFLARQDTTERAVTGEVLKDYFAAPATLEKHGTVQLTNDADSDNENKAVTPKGVKTSLANYLPLNGGTLNGALTLPQLTLRGDGQPFIHLYDNKNQLAGGLNFTTGGDVYIFANNDEKTASTIRVGKDRRVDISGNTNILPVGAPIPWPTETPPPGWLKCNGATFDKNTYPELAKAYPSGVLPDLRGEFIRGWDDGRGIDAGRGILSGQEDAIRNITGQLAVSVRQRSAAQGALYYSYTGYTSHSQTSGDGDLINFDASRVVPTAEENRPRNIAFLYIVRAA